jgi:hypothetical protein
MTTTANAAEQRDALVERLFMDAIGAFDLFSVYLGDVLGLCRLRPVSSPRLRAYTSGTPASGWSTRRRAACSSWSWPETPATIGFPRATTRRCSIHRA